MTYCFKTGKIVYPTRADASVVVRRIKKRWDGLHLSERTIHEPSCPLHRWWMTEDNLRSIERDGS